MIFWLFLEKIDCFPLKYLLSRRLASLLPRLASIFPSVSIKMSSITPKRKRLTLEQKIQIIEESEVPGFKPKKAMDMYGISQPAVYKILKEKNELLKTFKNSPSAPNDDNELEDEPVHDSNQNEIVTIDRAMTCLTDLRAYLQSRGDNSEALQTLIQVERGLIKDKIESKKSQPRITHFFQ